jgi:hypothetical protein
MHAQWPKHAEMEHINHHLQWDPPMFAGDSFLFFFAGEQYPSLAR